MPIFGAATVTRQLSPSQLWGMIIVGLCYHIFGYVFNDVIDLPQDKLSPRRANDPMVTGKISRRQALWVSLLPLPTAVFITIWLQGGSLAYFALLLAFGSGAVYNLWGKRMPIPLLTDMILGLAWAGIILYGAAIVRQSLTVQTWILLFVVTLFIIILVGIHGSLLDLASDLKGKKMTTAIWLGARPKGENGRRVPLRFLVYHFTLQGALCAFLVWPLLGNAFGYTDDVLLWTRTAVVGMQIICLILSLLVLRVENHLGQYMLAYTILSLFSVITLFLPAFSYQLGLALLLTYFIPLLLINIRFTWIHRHVIRGRLV